MPPFLLGAIVCGARGEARRCAARARGGGATGNPARARGVARGDRFRVGKQSKIGHSERSRDRSRARTRERRVEGRSRRANGASWVDRDDGRAIDNQKGRTRRRMRAAPRTFDVRRDDATSTSTSTKRVTFVRHAEGFHNLKAALTFDTTYNSSLNFDARLTPRGEAQCRALAETRGVCEDCDLVVTSSMTRCVQTSLLSFPTLTRAARDAVPFVANEDLRETANYWCDRRRTTEELEREFGDRVDFSACPMRDELWERYERIAGPPDAWTKHRESCDLYYVANRCRAFFEWLERRPERRIVVSTHSALLRCMFSYGHPGGVRAAPEQIFDSGGVFGGDTSKGVPVVSYGDDVDFAARMREDFDNCEYRTCFVDFAPRAV